MQAMVRSRDYSEVAQPDKASSKVRVKILIQVLRLRYPERITRPGVIGLFLHTETESFQVRSLAER